MADNVTLPASGSVVATDDVGGVQFQRVKLDLGADGASTPAVGTLPVSAPSNLPTSNNATIFQFSTQNTSTTQLTAGSTFTGVIETALDQPSISLLLASDQPITLTVKQFIDLAGTRAVPDIVFYVAANTGFSRSFTINGNYVQVTATNTGASTTTTFSLNTAYGDLGDSESGGIMPVTELPLVLTGAAAQTATVNNILTPTSGSSAINVSGFRCASVQVTSTASGGTFIFEQSNDGSNWISLPVFNAALVTGVPITAAITATSGSIVYTFPLRCTFLRLRIATTITGGSVQAFTRIGTDPWTASAQLVASNTSANLQTTSTVTGYPTAAASADSLANPTITQIGSDQMNYNGATWDRVRNNINTTTGDTGAKTATFNGATQTNYNAKGAYVNLVVGTVSGTAPTLVAKLQISPDSGTTWVDVAGATTASIVASGNYTLLVYPGVAAVTNSAVSTALPRTWRVVYTIGGTTPSFTLTSVQVAYMN